MAPDKKALELLQQVLLEKRPVPPDESRFRSSGQLRMALGGKVGHFSGGLIIILVPSTSYFILFLYIPNCNFTAFFSGCGQLV